MSRKIKYSKGPIDKENPRHLVEVPDFLPPPEELARRMKNTKITISLSDDSVASFKEEARKHHVQYQRMIRQVLDEYVAHQKQGGKR